MFNYDQTLRRQVFSRDSRLEREVSQVGTLTGHLSLVNLVTESHILKKLL